MTWLRQAFWESQTSLPATGAYPATHPEVYGTQLSFPVLIGMLSGDKDVAVHRMQFTQWHMCKRIM